MMSQITQRKWIDFCIFVGAGLFLDWAGTPWWALLVLVPFGIWNFYDGMTRNELEN